MTTIITVTIRNVFLVSIIVVVIIVWYTTFKIEIVHRHNDKNYFKHQHSVNSNTKTITSTTLQLTTPPTTNNIEAMTETTKLKTIIVTQPKSPNSEVLQVQSSASSSLLYQCPHSSYTNGEWKQRKQNDDNLSAANNSNTIDNNTNNIDTDGSMYEWVIKSDSNSNNCTLQQWNKTLFCQLINGRSILFVGDSLTGIVFKSLLHQYSSSTNGTVEQYQFIAKKTIPVQVRETICQQQQYDNSTSTSIIIKSSTVTFVRNDWISTSNVIKETAVRSRLLTPWIHLIQSNDIFIFNTGAHGRSVQSFRSNIRHIRNEIQKYNENQQNQIQQQNQNQQQQYVKKQVLFWTTPRGHINQYKIIMM
jgi:hypothetical protein